MKKILLFLIGFLFTLSLSAQSWIVPANGWAQQRVKVIYRDSIYLAKPIYFGGAVSGYIIIKPDNAAQGTIVIPSSASTDTLSTKAYARSVGGVGGAGMIYPGSGIEVSTGSTWGASVTNNSTNWNTAYTDRLKWDGGATDLVAATGRTSLGATTVGSAFFTLANPSAITFPRIDAANTVTARSATELKTDLSLGNVTNESKATMFTNPTFTGTVTIPTPFTLGAVSVTSTGTQLNYLSGATGTTGTGSVVLSASPTFTGHPTIEGVTSTGATGSGDFVFATSPTLITPALGTPSAIVLTNATGTAASLTSGAVTNGVYTTDTTTMLTPYIERKDTTGMLSTYILDSEARTAINDTTTARLAAALEGAAARDSTGTIDPLGVEKWVTKTYLQGYVPSSSSLSVKRLRFIVDVTTDAPTAGDSAIAHSYFMGRDVDVYREGIKGWQNFTAVNAYEGWRFDDDSTIIVNPIFQANEKIIIECLEPFAGIDYLAIESNESTLLDSLKSYWKMDDISGDLVDFLGYKNLWASGAPTPQQTGKIGYSWLYNSATDDYHTRWDTTSFNFADAFSVSVWIKAAATEDGSIIGKADGATPVNGWTLEVHNSTATFEMTDGGVQKTVTSTTDVTDGTWHHLCITYDGTMTLYVDGVSEGTPIAATYGYGTYAYFRTARTLGQWYSGNIDNMAFWHKELSSAEVTELFDAENIGSEYPWP